MKKTARKSNSLGRPRSKARSELTASLIERQDEQARRTAGRIAALRREYVDLDDADRQRARCFAVTRERLVRVPAELTPLIIAAQPGGESVVHRAMAAGLRSALVEVADELDASDDAAPPPYSPPVIRASRTLAGARARSARLSSELMRVRRAIARGLEAMAARANQT